MGGLKPVGSEKLGGMDKIRRIMEIAKYNHQLPNNDIKLESTEYRLSLSDGNSYEIVKERQGYIIKRNITESFSDYIEPMKNRRYYRSYSEALKKLNLMAKDFNSLYGNEEGTNLFTEQKKFKLKVPKPKADVAPTEAPTLPEPSPEPSPAPAGGETGGMPTDTAGMESPDMGGSESPDMGMGGPEMGGEEPGMESPDMGGEEMDMEEPDMEEPEGESEDKGGVSFKMIQKLTGKLAQKIRKYLSDEELDSDDTKYILNSIISSLDVDVLSDEDVEEIIDRLEGEEEEESGEEMDMEEPDMEEPEGGEEMGMETPPPMEPEGGEMKEYGYRNKNRMRVSPMRSEMFNESKVDNIIKNYFVINENEERQLKNKQRKNRMLLEENYSINRSEIQRLSKTFSQEKSAMKFLRENPEAVLWGSTNKNNLVFRIGLEEHKISPNGRFVL
jgi:hypothetical protein